MPKGKGPGAPYGNKNAAGPHKRRSITLAVKGGRLVKHSAKALKKVLATGLPGIYKSRSLSGERAAVDFYNHLAKFHPKALGTLKSTVVKRQKRYRKNPFRGPRGIKGYD